MKKENVYKLLYIISALLVLGFAVSFGINAYKYSGYKGSAPLYVYAIINAVEFFLPAIIFFTVASILKRKHNR